MREASKTKQQRLRLKRRSERKATHKLIAPAALAALLLALLLSVYVIRPSITGHVTQTSVSLRVTGIILDYNCSLTLVTGWNLASMPCSAANNSVESVLGSISSSYYSIHNYDANDAQDPWKSYKPDLPGWVEQDLRAINASRGYWMRMVRNASLNVTGTMTLPFTVRLEKGWNLVGYPTNNSDTPASLFSSINSSITEVYAYNATDNSDNWKAYSPTISGSLNDLTLIVPYWGYWINATAAADWRIPMK